MILQITKFKVTVLHMNLRKFDREVTCPMSLTSDMGREGVMKLVFLSKMRGGFLKVSPRVKILWRICFSQKYHKKDI